MYRLTLPMHPELVLAGVYDRLHDRRDTMAELTGSQAYADFDALLADPAPQIVLNLTNPHDHYETTKALLNAGKHVYTEKPLAMRLDHAQELTQMARDRGLHLVSAPCTLLNPVAQTLWASLRDTIAGRVRLVHAEMEDGMVPRAPVEKWINEAGVPWPAVDEFEVGCTVEHAGYVLSWLCAMFGPVVEMTAHSEELMPDKIDGKRLTPAPDFSVSIMKFESGVVARMTNGIYAAHDHGLTVFADDGVISVEDPRSDTSPIKLRRYQKIRRRRFLSPLATRIKPKGPKETIAKYRGSQTRDFCRAIADMAGAIVEGRAPYTSPEFACHITEVTLAAHFASHPSGAEAGFGPEGLRFPYKPVTRFEPIKPLGQD